MKDPHFFMDLIQVWIPFLFFQRLYSQHLRQN
jgi:hypothetical protein